MGEWCVRITSPTQSTTRCLAWRRQLPCTGQGDNEKGRNVENNPVSLAYDKVAAGYDSEYERAIDKAEDRYVAGLIKNHMRLDRGASLLDIGCGTGHFLDLIPEFEGEYVGIDPSRGMLDQFYLRHIHEGKSRNYGARTIDLKHGTAAGTGQSNDEFDAAVSLFGSWSYETDGIAAFSELARVLKPGGRFLLVCCGHRYITRRNYIFNKTGDIHAHCYYGRNRIPLIEARVPALRFDRVYGFNAIGDGTYGRLGAFCASWGLRFEAATLGRLAPELCFWTVLSGEKRV